MAYLTPLTNAQLFQQAVEQYAAEAAVPAQTDTGSTLGAMFEAAALLGLQLQQQAIYLAAISRLATSTGADIDSFCAPFGVTRLAAIQAYGAASVTYASPVITAQLIPVGAIVQTAGGLQFVVIADATNPAYNATANGYYVAIGQTTVSPTVQCTTSGIIGNVAANTITQIYGGSSSPPIPGLPTVTNVAAFATGTDPESDDALSARFTITVASGRVGTGTAIIAAALAVQTGVIYSFGDQVNPDLSQHTAFFTFVVNEGGTGTAPSAALISAVTSAIEAVRPAGVSYTIMAPTLVPVNGVGTIVPVAGYDAGTVQAAVAAQYAAFVNAIGLNPDTTPTTCSLARCYASLLQTQVNGVNVVFDVTGLQLNGSAGDVTAVFGDQLVAGSANFTVT